MRESKIKISAEDEASRVFEKIADSFDRLEQRMDSLVSTAKKLAAAFAGFQVAKGVLGWLQDAARMATNEGQFTAYERGLAKVGDAWDKIKMKIGASFDDALGKVFERLEPIMDKGLETMYRIANAVSDVLIPAFADLLGAFEDVFVKGLDAGASASGKANNTILSTFKTMATGVIESLTVVEQIMGHFDKAWQMATLSASIQVLKLKDVASTTFGYIRTEWERAQEILHPSKETLAFEKEYRDKSALWMAENRRPDLTGMTDERLAKKLEELRSRDPRRTRFTPGAADPEISRLEKELAKTAGIVFGEEFANKLRTRLGALGTILGIGSGVTIPAMRQFVPGGDAAGGGLGGGGGAGSGSNLLESRFLTRGSLSTSNVAQDMREELKKANLTQAKHLQATLEARGIFRDLKTILAGIEAAQKRFGIQRLR